MAKTFRNSPAVPNRAAFSTTSSLTYRIQLPMPQSQLAQPSLHLPQLSYFFFQETGTSLFSPVLSFTRESPRIAMSMILASFARLSTKMISGLLHPIHTIHSNPIEL